MPNHNPLEQELQQQLAALGVGPGSRLLVAISGGLDSVVLVYMLYKLGYKQQLAHVNYHLRGEESIRDEAFVREFAALHQLSLHCFDRPITAEERQGRSLQELTREIRYSWFASLQEKLQLDYLVTAHQADDQAETLLMQLGRGAGIMGLSGMSALTQRHIRPLLHMERSALETYATQQGLNWVEDSSNAGDYYLRNRFRHHVLPALREAIPGMVPAVVKSADHLREAGFWLEKAWWSKLKSCIQQVDNGYLIQLQPPLTLPEAATLWHMLLHKLELPMLLLQGCMLLRDKQKGKTFETAHWRIVKEQDALRILALEERQHQPLVQINSVGRYIFGQGCLEISAVSGFNGIPHALEIFVDADKLSLPLLLRNWEKGDMLSPFGMNGTKKVSDIYTDAHLGRAERDKFPVLCTAEEILWVCGLRRSKAAPIVVNTRNIWRITWQQG
jgi:tRNA(Ile)-lysidine synthase